MSVTIETTRNVYLDDEGTYIQVGPDVDGLVLVVLGSVQ